MRYETIIWDWNGTLLHDAGLCRRIMNGLLKQRRMPVMSRRRYEDVFDFPVLSYYQKLGFDFQNESFEALGNAFMAGYEQNRNRCRLQSGARRILKSLHGLGVRQAMLSAYRQDSLETLLASKGLSRYFELVVGADDHYAHGKSEQGRRLKRRLGNANSILMVGDTLHDVEVASAMGVDCALVYSGHQSRQRIASSTAPVFDRLHDLHDWLLKGT